MSFDHTVFHSPTGARMALRVREAEGSPRGIVQIHHGMSEHGKRYAPFADHLSKAGFVVAAPDCRGHGWTQADDSAPMLYAHEQGWGKVMDDALAVEDHMRDQFPGLPYIVFGHSMGGVFAMNHALARRGEIDGLAVWNSNLALGSNASLMRLVLGLERLFKPVTAPDTWVDALTFKTWGKKVKGGKGGSDWLSRIPEEVAAYDADPRCGEPATISLWYDFLKLVERGSHEVLYKNMPRTLPIHLVAGGDDPATIKGAAVKTLATRLRMAGFKDLTFRLDPDARHETLNDIGREQAMADFTDWALKAISKSG